MIPVLETERLVLRGPTLADFEDSYAMWRTPEVNKHIGGKPRSEEETWARIQRYAGHWVLLGFGMWMVRDREGEFVGEVGFMDYRRDMTPKLTAIECGWVLTGAHHGKGYATEAMRAALAWGDTHLGQKFECIIDHDNAPSIRVAEKLGFAPYTTGELKGERVVLFRRG